MTASRHSSATSRLKTVVRGPLSSVRIAARIQSYVERRLKIAPDRVMLAVPLGKNSCKGRGGCGVPMKIEHAVVRKARAEKKQE
jgi:hypothetical protein